MRHKLCRSFHPWCPGVKNRCLSILYGQYHYGLLITWRRIWSLGITVLMGITHDINSWNEFENHSFKITCTSLAGQWVLVTTDPLLSKMVQWIRSTVKAGSGTNKADSSFVPSQWETLQSYAVSHGLGANLESALAKYAEFITMTS